MTEVPAGNLRSYRSLLDDRLWRRWTLASGLTRLPMAMAPLGLVLAGHYATGSFADGALLAGVQGGFRAFVPALLGERAALAFALDASMIELEWISGPAVVAAVALAGLPYLAVAAMLAATVAAILGTALLPQLAAPV